MYGACVLCIYTVNIQLEKVDCGQVSLGVHEVSKEECKGCGMQAKLTGSSQSITPSKPATDAPVYAETVQKGPSQDGADEADTYDYDYVKLFEYSVSNSRRMLRHKFQ